MSESQSDDSISPERTIVMSDALDASKNKDDSDQRTKTTEMKQPLNLHRQSREKTNWKVTNWLMHFYSTVSNDSSPTLDDKSKVSLDSLAEINASPDIQEGFENIGDNFVMQKEIARGGQGVIARAYDKHCSRTVAIKSLHKNLSESDKARKLFLTEAQITAQLEHPSIIPIYGIFGDQENGLHIAMKMVHGKSLKQYLEYVVSFYNHNSPRNIRKNENDNLKKRLGYFLNIVDAISYVHHKHIIHKDLKPENIMIGAFGETYIMDWGISEKVTKNFVKKKPSGTLQYIAPEVINSEPYDTRSDIYLLGLILFEITFLKPAYSPSDTDEAIHIAKEAIISTPVHKFGCHVDTDLCYIIEKALAISPDERYQTAEELGKDIRAYLQGDIVSASPYQRLQRIFKFIRRHAKLVLVTLAIFLLIFFATNSIFIGKAYMASKQTIERQKLVTTLTSTSLKKAEIFEHALNEYTNSIRAIALEAATRLENARTLPEDVPVPDIFKEFGSKPNSLIFSPAYNNLSLSFDTLLYKLPPEKKPEHINKVLTAIAPMKTAFLSLILRSSRTINKGRRLNTSLMEITQHERPPLFNTFIGFNSGLHISYPFKNDFPENYDPRTKLWYTKAQQAARGDIVITEPYFDKGQNHELVMTFASPLLDSRGFFYGVAAADMLIERCQKLIQNYRNTSQRTSRTMIVDKKRQILLDATFKPNFSASGISTPEFPLFRDAEAFEQIQNMHNGVLFSTQNEIEFLYIFKYIGPLDAYYLESINITKLQKMQDSQPATTQQ
ncbi:MAG: protein kinase [Victivallales bacterium]|nr:protein kinase [Victivallales bacterium]